MQVENPIVIDSLWSGMEQEPEVVEACEACGEAIVEGEDMLEVDNSQTFLHDEIDCIRNYIYSISDRSTAGE